MVRYYLLVYWYHFCQIHGIEKEKIRTCKLEKGLQVWEGQMFFRPTERGAKKEGDWKREWRVRKFKLEKTAWRGEQGRKATSTATSKSRVPLCLIPVRKQEECLAFHIDRESKWATKTSPPSPLIRCLFPLPSSTKGCGKKQGKLKKNEKKIKWTPLPGV